MTGAYETLLGIWERSSLLDFDTVAGEVCGLLQRHGIRLRHNDGELMQITFSVPTIAQSSLVLGLRYRNRDSSFTEDHFLCRRGVDTHGLDEPHYRRSLEQLLPEYRGTHKQQTDLGSQTPAAGFVTHVNTISFEKGQK